VHRRRRRRRRRRRFLIQGKQNFYNNNDNNTKTHAHRSLYIPGMMRPAMVQFLSFSHCIFRIFSPLHRRRRRRTTTTTKQTRYKKQTTKSVNTNYPKASSAK
jgi:hypothetical protein